MSIASSGGEEGVGLAPDMAMSSGSSAGAAALLLRRTEERRRRAEMSSRKRTISWLGPKRERRLGLVVQMASPPLPSVEERPASALAAAKTRLIREVKRSGTGFR